MNKSISEKIFIENKISQIPSDALKYLNIETVRENLSFIYKEYLRCTEDLEFAKDFQKNIPLAHLKTEDYLYKTLEIEGVSFWLSLRFLDRNIGHPFIDVLFFDCEFKFIIDHIQTIKSQIKNYYSFLEYKNIRFTIYEKDFEQLDEIEHEDDLYIMGKVFGENKVEIETDICIESISELSKQDYEIYQEEYKIFNEEFPALSFVRAEDFEKLQHSAHNNLLFKIFKKDEYIGLFAFVEDFYEVYYGYCVFEKKIFKKYRGNNFSYVSQVLIENELSNRNQNKPKFLIGTISPLNISSLKTAIKSGRKILMKQVMINP